MKQKKDKKRKYYFNYDIFENIDTPEKAYWLGFLYADGYITAEHGGFGLALNEKDKEHLFHFAKFLGLNDFSCIKRCEKTKSYRICLNDTSYYDILVKKGFNSQKSYDNTIIVWENIPEKYKKFFILGFWDGDGYVSITAEGKNATGCVSNNEALIDAFVSYINKNFDEGFCRKTSYDYPRIRFVAKKAKKFLDWLYLNAPIFLDRKYKKYLQFKISEKYDRPYSCIRKLPSKRFFVQKQYKGIRYTIGTFDTIKEAVDAYNEKAREIGFKEQEYIGEYLKWEEQ